MRAQKSCVVAPSSLRININRPVYTEDSFNKQFMKTKRKESNRSFRGKIDILRAKIISKCHVGVVLGFFPIMKWLPNYSLRNDTLPDLIGGLTVGIMHIPQGKKNCL